MRFGRTIAILLMFTIYSHTCPPPVMSADPYGQLYWKTSDGSSQWFAYDGSAQDQGAVAAIDYECRLSPGSGTFTGNITMAQTINVATRKTGTCEVNRLGLILPGNSYTAYLYCNGERRTDDFDDGPCEHVIISADVNGDDTVDLTDAILALQVVGGVEPPSAVFPEADVNADGRIGIEEALEVLRTLAN